MSNEDKKQWDNLVSCAKNHISGNCPIYEDETILNADKHIKELEQQLEETYNEARRLALSLWRLHYADESPNFELCDTTAGIISQIDNMVSGLTKK